MNQFKTKSRIDQLIVSAERVAKAIRYKSRLKYMDKLQGEFKGVQWRSLNPTSKQIRANDVKEICTRARKMLHEVYSDSEYLNMLLNKPVERLKYYNRARQRIR